MSMQYRSSSTMRARPLTWPAIRLKRLSVAALLSFAMAVIYPLGVFRARVQAVTAEHHHRHDHHHTPAGAAIDPVCGMAVDPHNARHRAEYRGRPFYFCSAGCRAKFTADPQKYLGGRRPEPVPEGTVYTCPMHPEIRQIGSGACPICGMALEPEID